MHECSTSNVLRDRCNRHGFDPRPEMVRSLPNGLRFNGADDKRATSLKLGWGVGGACMMMQLDAPWATKFRQFGRHDRAPCAGTHAIHKLRRLFQTPCPSQCVGKAHSAVNRAVSAAPRSGRRPVTRDGCSGCP